MHIRKDSSLKIKDHHGHLVDFKNDSSPIGSTTNRESPLKTLDFYAQVKVEIAPDSD
jgi:hypothetical protein